MKNKAGIYLFFLCPQLPAQAKTGENQKTREERDEQEPEAGTREQAMRREMLEDGKKGNQNKNGAWRPPAKAPSTPLSLSFMNRSVWVSLKPENSHIENFLSYHQDC